MSGGSSASSASRSMESRTGRDKQRESRAPASYPRVAEATRFSLLRTDPCVLGYNLNGERLVAGVVPLSKDKKKVLMIRSTKRKGWVLPKGGWETDEGCPEAASREAWEEAGIHISIEYDLGDIVESRTPKKGSTQKCLYRFYEATVIKEAKDWPEVATRERRWMSFADAMDALKDRPELAEALERSTMRR